jgi:6-phosphogluconolactonase
MKRIRIYPDKVSLSQAVTKQFIIRANHAIETSGRFSVALAGGSTPQNSYQLLALPHNANQIDWSKVHLFWGDERNVPADDAASNFMMVKEALLDNVRIPSSNVHRIKGELRATVAAQGYQQALKDFFGEFPAFNLILLGMGTDGHTASLFPETKALNVTKDWVTADYVKKISSWRITLTYPVINQANTVIFMVSGEEKADTVNEVINGEFKPNLYPSQGVRPIKGEVFWYLDQKSAKYLKLNSACS